MIILAKPSKPFTFTGKGSIRKSAVVADYADEIKATYAAVEAATSANVEAPKQWTKDSTADFVRTVVLKVIESKVGDKDDIFQHGADRSAYIPPSDIVIVLKRLSKQLTGNRHPELYCQCIESRQIRYVKDCRELRLRIPHDRSTRYSCLRHH